MESAYEGDSQGLRIVLLGVSGAGKSAIGNAILGRDAFKAMTTRETEIQTGIIEDRNISIINTPGFFNTHMTDEELQTEMMKSLYLSDPGPHVFLLIINLESFKKDDERKLVEQILENFEPQAFKFTVVVFTGREKMSNREWGAFIHSTEFRDLVTHCRDRYHAINSKNEINQTHITELLEKIDDIIKHNDGQHYSNKIYSISRTKCIRTNKKQEEEKTYKRKELQIQQKQEKTTCETFTTYSVIEERITRTVIEQEERKSQEEENAYRSKKQEKEKEARQEHTKIKSETFEMESATEEKSSHTLTEEKEGTLFSYLTQTNKTTHTHENLDTVSIDRFEDFANEGVRKKSWRLSNTSTYHIPNEDFRIVMVGKTGVGKSATGNTILKDKLFKEELSFESVTKTCQKHHSIVDCRNISVIDTPGLFDTSICDKKLKKEIGKCVEMSVPGPHAFLIIIRLDVRFTDEERNTVKWIQKNFGKDAERYTIILFTRGDLFQKASIKDMVTKNKEIKEIVSQCGGRYHVFNNNDGNPVQVTKLLKKIVTMVKKNGGQYYTNEMYKEAQKKIMMKKAQNAALVGAAVAGAGAAVAGGAVLVAATGGVALPAALMAGGAALTGGPGAKVIADKFKHIKEKRRNDNQGENR